MVISIASGKGGTGKTTVAVNLAHIVEEKVQLLDCDVEAPNDHLFLNVDEWEETIVNVNVPSIYDNKCDGCGDCSAFCEFNAIMSLKDTCLVFPELCHSCRGCIEICPQSALMETPHRIGVIRSSNAHNLGLVQGWLDVGVAMSPPLIRQLKQWIVPDQINLIDAPPGTSCPVINSISDSDFVILVTEPTPFGLHDLQLAVEMLKTMSLLCGVVVNRVGIGDNRIHQFCDNEGIPILTEIPDDRRIAEAYARGEMMVEVLPEYRKLFEQLYDCTLTMNKVVA